MHCTVLVQYYPSKGICLQYLSTAQCIMTSPYPSGIMIYAFSPSPFIRSKFATYYATRGASGIKHFSGKRFQCNRVLQVRPAASSQGHFLTAQTSLTDHLVSVGTLSPEDVKLFQTLTESRAALFCKVLNQRTRHITFVLDGVHGAHNLAAIARSCDAWGIQDLHVIQQQEDDIPKTGRGASRFVENMSLIERFKLDQSLLHISKGSQKWLTIEEHQGVKPCLETLKKRGYKIIVSSLSSSATPIQDVPLSEKCAFVFGNEKTGVTQEMISNADSFFTIPMMGFVESMNVSVAVGTTASLTSSKCRQSLSFSKYLLSPSERRQIAHSWLMNMLKPKISSKSIQSPLDVTKLGMQCERRIEQEGIFASIEDKSLNTDDFWRAAFRLGGETGALLATYVTRRKFGAISDRGFEKRCKATSYFLAGSHALSCKLAITNSQLIPTSKSSFFTYFKQACALVHAIYSPYFDTFGNPSLPVHARESESIFHELRFKAQKVLLPICLQYAQEELNMGAKECYSIISGAGLRDIVRCISDTMKCEQSRALKFEETIVANVKEVPSLLLLMKQRDPSRIIEPDSSLQQFKEGKDRERTLSSHQRDVLQIFLRLANVVYLSSEIHQLVWHRLARDHYVSKARSLQLNIVESVLCESFAEMIMLNSSIEMALLRPVVEWDQMLVSLKNQTASCRDKVEVKSTV